MQPTLADLVAPARTGLAVAALVLLAAHASAPEPALRYTIVPSAALMAGACMALLSIDVLQNRGPQWRLTQWVSRHVPLATAFLALCGLITFVPS